MSLKAILTIYSERLFAFEKTNQVDAIIMTNPQFVSIEATTHKDNGKQL